MEIQVENIVIKMFKGDITDQKTDVIVNAANEQLFSGSGVCGAIFKKAGTDLKSHLDYFYEDDSICETGDVVITPSFNLPSKYIYHAVGPIYAKNKPEISKQLLEKTYNTCLQHA